MSPTIYLLTLGVFFGTILAVFAMKYLASARQAQARILAEGAYRAVAEKAAAAQSDSAASLSAMKADLAEIKARMAAVEKILKEVG
ncbi:MAG: hypothetical protein WDN01_13600 [Rhizomicrobium sp.]